MRGLLQSCPKGGLHVAPWLLTPTPGDRCSDLPAPHPLQNKPLVKKVVLLAAHGLDSALWESPAGQAALPTWRRCLGEPIELQARNATLAPGA